MSAGTFLLAIGLLAIGFSVGFIIGALLSVNK